MLFMKAGAPILATGAALLAAEIPAQTTAEPPQIRSAPADIVAVDVNVVDSKGRPVGGLGKADFILFEDERRVEIDVFEAPPPSVTGNTIQPPERRPWREGDVPTLVVYVDRWLLGAAGRRRVLDQVQQLAEGHVRSGGRVVVVADEDGLRALTPATSDQGELRAALSRIGEGAALSSGESDERATADNLQHVAEGLGCETPALLGLVRGYAARRVAEMAAASDALGSLVDALSGIPGRKRLLYVSEGLEQRPGIQLFARVLEICPALPAHELSAVYSAMQEYETSELLKTVAARANAARVTIDAFDARGLATSSAADISRDMSHVPSAKTDAIRDANLTNPLLVLAEETGGLAIIRGLDARAAMRRLESQAGGQYLLGFTPGGLADGRTHALRVAVKGRSRIEVRHRRSYLRHDAAGRRAQRAVAGLLFGVGDSPAGAEIDLRMPSAPLTRSTATLHVQLPLASLVWEAAPDGPVARVRIVVAFRAPQDGDRATAAVREKEFVLRAPNGQEPLPGARQEVVVGNLRTGDGDIEIVVGVEDLVSGRVAYTRRLFRRQAEPAREPEPGNPEVTEVGWPSPSRPNVSRSSIGGTRWAR